jgi:leukotriene-A4 hydrolase
MKPLRTLTPLLAGLPLLAACAAGPATAPGTQTETRPAVRVIQENDRDPHSFSHPDEVAVDHLALDLTVDFAERRLDGRASLRLDHRLGSDRLVLDTRDLEVRRVTLDGGREARFTLGDPVPHLGRPLEVQIEPGTEWVHVEYSTSPEAAALQWLTPEQAGSPHPFLYTQSQAILARTWAPVQDTPSVRMTYEATVRVPPGLLAVMSAENPTEKSPDGVYRFRMPQRIPAYLLALGVGDLEFRRLGPNSGVYALPQVADRAAWELADTPRMIEAAEKLYGPYQWGRYDVLILPASYPFGGMENPRLTFATPTILAGDRSLVALVAHELAHSWSGNLVTNATWNDFWLNEGFTTYFESRIMEAVYGKPYADMLSVLGRQDLDQTIAELGQDSPDTHLFLDLAGRDPDDGMTDVAYNKGALLLASIERAVGRQRFDRFLREYFDRFAFQSMDTRRFVEYLKEELLAGDAQAAAKLRLDDWIYGPGVPPNAAEVRSPAFEEVDRTLAAFAGGTAAGELKTAGWNTHQWLHFLRNLPKPMAADRMADLDAAFGFSASRNSEILAEWLLRVIENRYQPAWPALERFLTEVGRRKFLKPIYTELAKTPEGMESALRIYARARPGYHSVSQNTVDEILDWRG